MKTDILGIQFDNLTREEAKEAGAALLRSPEFHYAVTPNPEFILAADKDLEFQKILNQADLVLPDGIGVVYSAKILGTPLKGRGQARRGRGGGPPHFGEPPQHRLVRHP